MNQSGPTIRLKLTLLYAGMFFVCGLLLLAVTYGLVRRELGGEILLTRNGVVVREIPRADEALLVRRARADALRTLRRQSFFAMLVLTGISAGFGWFIAGRVLAPIRTITEHARTASATTLDQRLALTGPDDELKALADTIDAMLDRLQAAFTAQQAFSAQASHELRTPLATIRAETDLLLGNPALSHDQAGSARAIQIATIRSEHLIDGLLTLARSESTMFDPVSIDLAEAVGDVMGESVEQATASGIHLDLNLQTALVPGDPVLLRQMIANLVQNAIRYNEPGGLVRTQVRPIEGSARLTVENTGPIIPPSEIEHLFRPFVRSSWAQQNRSGYGLGLAIVQSVVHRHGGSISAIAQPTGGLHVSVDLPAMK